MRITACGARPRAPISFSISRSRLRTSRASYEAGSSKEWRTMADTPAAAPTRGHRVTTDGKTGAALAATSLLVGLGVVLSAVPGHAQQPDSTAARPDTGVSAESLKKLSIEQLMNLQVTSVSKRPERLAQTASAIAVITGEEIRRSGASSLPEALRLASNLQVAQVDSRQWAISARGFNGTTTNKLLVLIDGRTVYTPLYSGVFWDVQQVPLADIDRVEVISGPGATLWGSNAVNGVINVITKHVKDTEGLLVSGGGGKGLRGAWTVRYGGALGSDVRYRVYGMGFFRDAPVLPSGFGGGDEGPLWPRRSPPGVVGTDD